MLSRTMGVGAWKLPVAVLPGIGVKRSGCSRSWVWLRSATHPHLSTALETIRCSRRSSLEYGERVSVLTTFGRPASARSSWAELFRAILSDETGHDGGHLVRKRRLEERLRPGMHLLIMAGRWYLGRLTMNSPDGRSWAAPMWRMRASAGYPLSGANPVWMRAAMRRALTAWATASRMRFRRRCAQSMVYCAFASVVGRPSPR